MDLILLGKIVGTHGIKGEVKILSDSDFKKERFKVGNTLYLKSVKNNIPIIINSYRVHKGLDLITFNNYRNINDVLEYIGLEVYVDYSSELTLAEDEYLYADLLNCSVYDTKNNFIGTILDLREVPQGTILEIVDENKKRSLVPFIKEFVIEVDLKQKRIILEPIEGLL